MWETGIELEMEAEKTATGEVTRPILLLQAEPHDQDRPDALTVEQSLIEEHHIPKTQIAAAIATKQ